MDTFIRNLKYAIRTLVKTPLFTLTVVLTLALGIGATTAMFSVVNGVVVKPLPYPDSEAVVTVTHSAMFGNVRSRSFPFSPQMLAIYGPDNQSFEELGMWRTGRAAVTGEGNPEQVNTLLVTEGTLRALEVQPELGRWFLPADDQPGAAETVILSYGYWQRRYGGDPGVIGRVMTIDASSYEVIGVMPAHFTFSGVLMDLILPLRLNMAQPAPDFNYVGLARLKDGVTLEQANADIGRMLQVYLDTYMRPASGAQADALRLEPAVRPFKEDVVGNVGQVLWVLLGSISILLLIACANVANLMLLRAEARGIELAVRTTLGARRGHIVLTLMMESLALSLLGGLVGIGLAYVGLQLLVVLAPGNLPRLNEITIDVQVLLFAVSISVLSGLLFGLVPMLKFTGQRFASNLAELVQGSGRWASAGKNRHHSQNTLVVVQVALALVLLVSSGLMIRTFQNLRSVEPGFTEPATIQTLRIPMPDTLRAQPESAVRLQVEILDQLAAIPGVTSAGYITSLPSENGINGIVAPEDKSYGANEIPPTRRINVVSPGLLRTLGTRLIAGRDFDWVEVYNQRNVAMVSESFAREEWSTVAGAIGKRIRIGVDTPYQEVIGVVADVYDNGPGQDAPASVYWPAREHPFVIGNLLPTSIAYVLRSDRTATESFLQEIRQVVSAVAPDLPLTRMVTMEEVYAASIAQTSFSLVLLGIAGVMALLLSIVGIYGVLAYAVMQRQREVGVRMALGAAPNIVKRMFVYRGMVLSAIGIALGTAVAAGLTRLMSSLLFGVTPMDAATFAAAAVFLTMAALSASYIPARRASHLDPMKSLRKE